MEVKAFGKNIGVSRIKATIPADVVRNMNALEAVAVLTYMPKGAALPIKKVIESAIANAKNNHNLDPATLYVREIKIDKGPQTKMNTRRMIPAAKGRAKFFDRKYCHIKVVLSDVVPASQVRLEKHEEAKVEKAKVTSQKRAAKDTKKA